jgi:ABC-type branched-subunit amino acid transport system substrate-binding protein
MQRRTLLWAGAAACLGTPAFAETGVSEREILVGQSANLSGALGVPIKARMVGAELAFSDIRKQGGVAGRDIRVLTLDDQLKPDKAVANYQQLLQNDKVFALFGCGGTATTAAAAEVLHNSGTVMIGGLAVGDSAREKVRGSAYFLRATSKREADVLVEHMQTIGLTRIAVATLDNPGGAEISDLIKASMAAQSLAPAAIAPIKGDGANMKDAAAKLAKTAPQAVIMYLGGDLAGKLINAIAGLDSHPLFYGMSIVPGELTAKVAGDNARGLVISQIVPYPWSGAEPVAAAYRDAATQAKLPVEYYGYEGYLTGLMLIEGLRRCGRDLTRSKLHATFQGLKFRLGGMEIDFNRDGLNGAQFVELVQVSSAGHFVR